MQTVTISDFENAIRRSRISQASSAVKYGRLGDLNLPLVIEATSSTVDLSAWLASHRDEVETHLLESGGVLFRGFGVDSPQAFEKVICALSDRLLDYSYRSTPRTVVSGKVYTSTEYPPHQTIPLHNENAYARSWPMKIWFFSRLCAPSGGETPIADSRRVYQRIPERIRKRFEQRGLRIIGMKFLRISQALAEKHYGTHAGKPFFAGLVNYITSSPVVVDTLLRKSSWTGLAKNITPTFAGSAFWNGFFLITSSSSSMVRSATGICLPIFL